MEYERKYLSGEKELYKQLSPEEQKEWDSLSEEDRMFNLELTGQKGEELCQKLKETSERIGGLNKKLNRINKNHNLFGF